ncbi:MAG: helix-turn-helix domain-containing protein [Nitrososphaeraceae archaeon]
MRRASKLNLSHGQKTSLESFMHGTTNKKEYRRVLAILQKSQGRGRSYEDIGHEHRVNIRSVQRWIAAFIHGGIEEVRIKKRPRGLNSRITDENKEIILSALFNDPHIFGYLRNTWSLRSLARCLTDELGIPISFKHLQRITKDMGIRCKRPKLELLLGEDYEEGKERVENYKQVASALKKSGDVSI